MAKQVTAICPKCGRDLATYRTADEREKRYERQITADLKLLEHENQFLCQRFKALGKLFNLYETALNAAVKHCKANEIAVVDIMDNKEGRVVGRVYGKQLTQRRKKAKRKTPNRLESSATTR